MRGTRSRRHRQPFLDGHWLRSLGFTVGLVGLVAAAIGADWAITIASLVICAVGFGFFYLLFPGGAHFGMTVANLLAIYICVFQFFREANFPAAPDLLTGISLFLPLIGFMAGCVLRRRHVYAIMHARRTRDLGKLPRLSRWMFGAVAVGAASFTIPRLSLDPLQQGLTLLVSMAVITAFVASAVRDVVLVSIDIAMVFENVAGRLDRLIKPLMAFLTFYSLLIVVFACLFRIADLTAPVAQFALQGQPAPLSFIDALYYSVATITTLGIGDISPLSLPVRALSAAEVVAGVLMLLFGFSEITRGAGDQSDARMRLREARRQPRGEPPESTAPDPPAGHDSAQR